MAGLDKLVAKKKNQKALIEALERNLQADPVAFFKSVIMPLLPKESKLSVDHDGVIEWRSLLGASNKEGGEVPAVGPAAHGGASRGEDGGIAATPFDGAQGRERGSHVGEQCGAIGPSTLLRAGDRALPKGE